MKNKCARLLTAAVALLMVVMVLSLSGFVTYYLIEFNKSLKTPKNFGDTQFNIRK